MSTEAISVTGGQPTLDATQLDLILDRGAALSLGDIIELVVTIGKDVTAMLQAKTWAERLAGFVQLINDLKKLFPEVEQFDVGPPRGAAFAKADHDGVVMSQLDAAGVDRRGMSIGLLFTLVMTLAKYGLPALQALINRIKERQGRGLAF